MKKALVPVILGGFVLTGCPGMSYTEQRVLSGGAIGVVSGAAIGAAAG